MEYKTAKSYRELEWVTEPFEEKGKMYVKVKEPCPKCGGQGGFACFAHRDRGVCYDCHGAGYFYPKVRLYTEDEIRKQEEAAARREAKKKKELEDNSEKNKIEWMKRECFGEDQLTWCVGGDTFAIKDWLKEQGCKFDPVLNWHCDHFIEVPEDYHIFSVSFDEVFDWNMYTKKAFYKEKAKEIVDRRFKEMEGPSLSEYVGEVGERLRNITAVYKSARGFSGQFGWTNIYTFQSGDDVLVWFTAKDLDLEKGAVVDLTATVKKHEEFRGVKTTQLSRAIIKEVK